MSNFEYFREKPNGYEGTDTKTRTSLIQVINEIKDNAVNVTV